MTRNDDEFGRGLREAGKGATAAFSSELHRRVMTEVRRERTRGTAAEEGIAWAHWVATALVLTVVTATWIALTRPRKPIAPTTPLVVVRAGPSLEEVVRETAAPVPEKLRDARFAYLDRDGMRLAKFLLRSVPGLTAADNPNDAARTTNQ
jgi:hypothetical protein